MQAFDDALGAQTSVDKLLLSTAEQEMMDAALMLLNTDVVLGDEPEDARRRDDWWYSRAASIYGGAREIQHSIIANRILGLPKETLNRGKSLCMATSRCAMSLTCRSPLNRGPTRPPE